MTNVLVVAGAILAVLQIGHCLKCEKCNGCETSKGYTETCKEIDPSTQVAACLTQRVRVSQNNEPLTVRKCAVYDKGAQYQCVDLPNTNPVACDICYSDMCNANPNAAVAIGATRLVLVGVVALWFAY